MDLNGNPVNGIQEKTEHITLPRKHSFTAAQKRKAISVLEACTWKDTDTLKALAISDGGLLSDELRRQAWPLLLGVETISKDEKPESSDTIAWQSLPVHRDEDQVRLDVERSFIYYPDNQSPQELNGRKEELSDLITEVLRRQPYLCYFQGYHDICQVFLLVLGPSQRVKAVSRLSALRIRDFMLPTLAPALDQLRLIPAILSTVNPQLCNHLSQTQPFFALSGTLTMYAHDIQEYGDIARLFDVLLAREAVFSVYLFAQIVLQRSDELFDTPSDEPEMLHSILSKLPKPLDIEVLIAKTIELFEQHPPETLRSWRLISSSSVLKTTRWQQDAAKQTLEDGYVYFQRQVMELQWTEKQKKMYQSIWKYRKPVSALGVALLVGVLSLYVKKSPGVLRFWPTLEKWWHIWSL